MSAPLLTETTSKRTELWALPAPALGNRNAHQMLQHISRTAHTLADENEALRKRLAMLSNDTGQRIHYLEATIAAQQEGLIAEHDTNLKFAERLSELNKELALSSSTNIDLNKEMLAAGTEREDLKAQVETWRRDFAELDAQKTRLEAEIATGALLYAECKETLSEERTAAMRTRIECQLLREAVIDEVDVVHEVLAHEMQAAKARLHAKAAAITMRNAAALSTRDQALKVERAENVKLHSTVLQQEARALIDGAVLSDELSSLEAAATKAEAEHERQRSRAVGESKSGDLASTVAELQEQVDVYKQKLREVGMDAEVKQRKIEQKYEVKLKQVSPMLDEKEAALRAARRDTQQRDEQLKSKEAELSEQIDELKGARGIVERLKERVQQLKDDKEIKDLRFQNEDLLKQMEALKAEIGKLKGKFASVF